MRAIVGLISDSRQALEERLSWLASTVGGANFTLSRLQTICGHVGILFLGMIICAFLNVDGTTRLLLVVGIPTNLALSLFDMQSLELLDLLQILAGSALTIRVIHTLVNRYLGYSTSMRQQSIQSCTSEVDGPHILPVRQNNTAATPINNVVSESNHSASAASTYNNDNNSFTSRLDSIREVDYTAGGDAYQASNDPFSYVGRPTPPRSYVSEFVLRGRSRTPALSTQSTDNLCQGITRQGTPCKSKASKESNYCFRHERGTSVFGS